MLVKHIDVVGGGSTIASPRGFRPGGVRRVDGSLNVERFYSRHPVDVRPAEVNGTHVLDAPSNVLVEGSPASDRPS